MGDAFLSVRGRVILNAEALNMTESVGNYVKHRRVPIIMRRGSEYVTIHVPAVSGEAIAHGYQELLAREALSEKLPVCKLCSRGIFLKSANLDIVRHARSNAVADIVRGGGGSKAKEETQRLAHEF